MKMFIPHSFKSSRQGMALVMVVSAVALMAILMVAIFTVTQTEYKSTQAYVNARTAKDLGDTAVSIVEAQIQNGQYMDQTQPRTFHATQPGMVRKYNADGSFNAAYKLYSSTQMIVTAQGKTESAALSNEVVPTDWAKSNFKARYVDINEPVVRPSLNKAGGGAGTGTVDVFFPIIDPRAAWNYLGGQTPSSGAATTQVEGFSYSQTTPSGGSASASTYQEVRTPATVTQPNDLRLPMPVEWMYILQDGTTGTLDSSNRWVSNYSGIQPTADNPMVGRVAFWTDDECCKVNINTASEPTFYNSPFYFSKRDYMWANCPPLIGEYQRYPGHPATVALSAVLAPGTRLDPLRPALDSGFSSVNDVVTFKNYIYTAAPKITTGGSQSGTLTFGTDDYQAPFSEINSSTVAQYIDVSKVKTERLFASVDEMLFQDAAFQGSATGASQTGPAGRKPAIITNLPGGRQLFNHDTLERSRFFLTAQSRAPEFTMYGLPRIAVWPLPDESLGAATSFRTSFDQAIALCSTLRGSNAGASIANSYIFRRAQAHSMNYDLNGSQGLQRNGYLLNYLVTQMSTLTWPQTSSNGTSRNYLTKYGRDNVNQLAVQFFDYVRSTNLYDTILSRRNDGTSGAGKSSTALYTAADQIGSPNLGMYTFTNQSITPSNTNYNNTTSSYDNATGQNSSADSNVMPGHGVVTPIAWSNAGNTYRGFGRFFTLSEIGFTCICTADGYPDPNGVLCNGQLSGGATARRFDPTTPLGQNVPQPNYTNVQAYGAASPYLKLLSPNANARWYSNFPPLSSFTNPPKQLLYGTNLNGPATTNVNHPANHPGYNPQNWNLSLAYDTPLQATEKRVQVMLMLEAFCPMLGWTKMYPEYAIVLDGNFIANMTLNGTKLFDTTGDVVLKSNGNTWQYNSGGTVPFGGHAGPSAMAGLSGGRPVSGTGNVVMPSDQGWTVGTSSGHNGLTNYGLNSNFITVNRNSPMTISFGSGPLTIKIYDKHDYANAPPVQIINVQFADSQLPTPSLVYNDDAGTLGTTPPNITGDQSGYWQYSDAYGRLNLYRSTQAPHWWCFNSAGCIYRMTGQVNPLYTPTAKPPQQPWITQPVAVNSYDAIAQTCHGRLDTTVNGAGLNAGAGGTWHAPTLTPNETITSTWQGSDVTRTMIPAAGDYRLAAAMYNVPSTMWQRHPLWTGSASDQKIIHCWTDANAGNEAGCKLPPMYPSGSQNMQLVNGILFGANATTDLTRTPDLPPSAGAVKDANRYGDFDTGIAGARCGPYVNKPDEGNFFIGKFTFGSTVKNFRSGYFFDEWLSSDDWRSGVYMSPNRMISSPVMFGSLPTGVYSGGSASQSSSSGVPGSPWQTLLFRPYSQSNTTGSSVATGHPGDSNPRDHYLLDMFCMPVVEPYAISEPLSMAGRINLNFQIMPFTNIRRATALHALMKGEFVTAIPNNMAYKSKTFNTRAGNGPTNVNYWDEQNDNQYWHRPINVKETLVQFDEKFNGTAAGVNHNISQVRGLFRSASQICEMHLIPDTNNGNWISSGESNPNLTGMTPSSRQNNMDTFWQNHSITGDNVRERPYSNIYNRVTTRSNTFRVHVRAQAIKKARSVDPMMYDDTKDVVLSEYRGSTLIERYIDPNSRANPLDPNDSTTAIQDYAASGNPLGLPPLESYYRFRALENKRFNP